MKHLLTYITRHLRGYRLRQHFRIESADERVTGSLEVTGPVWVKETKRGMHLLYHGRAK